MKKKVSLTDILVDLILIAAGSAILALAVACLLNPYRIVPGGFTGLGMVIHFLNDNLPLGLTVLVLNVPFFLISWRVAGGRFFLYTLYGTVISSLLIDLFDRTLPKVTADPLLAALFGGVMMGVGLGLVLLRGATTGGSDVAARLLKYLLPHQPVGVLMLFVDGLIIALAALVFGELTGAFYAVISVYVTAQVMDGILYGWHTARIAYIISDASQAVASAIGQELGRGVTILQGQGGFSGADKQVLLCAMKRTQVTSLKRVVKSIDPRAFIIVSEAHEVLGEGFGTYDKHAL